MARGLLKFLLAVGLLHQVHSLAHKQVLSLFKEKFTRDVYSPRNRPVKNSLDTMIVTVNIITNSIFNVDMNSEKIHLGESLFFSWTDEFLTWNPDDYGGVQVIKTHPMMIWLPLVYSVLPATNNEPFADAQGQVIVRHDGLVFWKPGSLPLGADCVEDFFDRMDCEAQLASKIHPANELAFVIKIHQTQKTSDTLDVEWKLLQKSITTINKTLWSLDQSFSTIQFDFTIGRPFTLTDLVLVSSMAMFSLMCVVVLVLFPVPSTKLVTATLLILAHGCFLRASGYDLPNLASLMNVPVSIFVGAILVKYVVDVCERERKKKNILKAGKRKANFHTQKTKSRKTAEQNGENFEDADTPSTDTELSDINNKIKLYKTLADKFYWVATFIFCASWLCAVAFVRSEVEF
ncbi:neuronal acetylcholine receptor subunit alpha-5-like [Physella acuta]|uniref:neuronal acetylcholine receptor subunit alpha-5-like n=1 Tax=Physella acuta TaxID=109671 RepID=UPI0027DE329C|nr:neuronal acetylcholine receptor subunit alpha-5-like [Physella acuta]XP_059169506.1 neuronal acetylcholine receptor subunit alpha-5-like [Physella acuta]